MTDRRHPARRVRLGLGDLIRLVPRGSSLLRLRRRGYAAARRRVYPIRPPLHSPEHVVALSVTADDHPFITGNRLAARCRYVINWTDLEINEDVDNDWWFCRSDVVEYFFSKHEPPGDYVLFSHNSDRPIDKSLSRFLQRRGLRAWFAANAAIDHPKLHAFPRGMADARWRHGDGAALLDVQEARLPKAELFDASYDISTFPPAREYCRDQTGIEPGQKREFDEYLRGLASSYFCIAPRGNGIDTHRLWEALYLRTVPVVTRSIVTDQHPDLPLVVLEDWSHFDRIRFSRELYEQLMADWDPDVLRLDRYMERVEGALRHGA